MREPAPSPGLRGRRRRAVPLLFLLLAAACERGGDAASTTAELLVVGAGADQTPSGAFQSRLGVYPLNANVAETLTRLTPDFRVEPLLATRWEYRGNNTWRFHLRPGVRFHDGRPLTAQAVAASITEAVRGDLGYGPLSERSAAAVDDSTVDIRTTVENLRLPEQLVHPNYSVFSPGSDPGRHPVGTGPFRWVEYLPRQRVVVERFAGYWGTPARLERIVFRFFPDPSTRVLALAAGEVDLVMDLPREQVPSIARQQGRQVIRAPVGQMLSLHVNANGEPPHELLRDRALRRAIALAVDRRQLIRDVWGGEGAEIQNMTVPAVLGPAARTVRGFAHDPREAARILEQMGWKRGADGQREKGGRKLTLVLLSSPHLEPSAAEFVQAQLRAVGIGVRWVRLPDSGSYAARLNAGEFDLDLTTPNQNDGNPLFLPALIFHSRSERPFARWHTVGARFDRLVDQGLRAADPAEGRRLAAEAIRVAVDEEAVVIPIAGRYRLYAASDPVRGFTAHPSQTHQSWSAVGLRAAAR